MHEREVFFVKTNSVETISPKLEAVGGYHLGYPWLMPEPFVIFHIKNKIEKYFIKINGRKMPISVAKFENNECLKIEGDSFCSENLFKLPDFPCDFPRIGDKLPWAL